jgi:hypothetical protein
VSKDDDKLPFPTVLVSVFAVVVIVLLAALVYALLQ